jgi:hypothetical protein
MLEERRSANRAAWARQHPQLAAAERSIRKQRADLLVSWKHKNEGTPETHEQASRHNRGALIRLYKNGTIDSEQLMAAEEINRVHERISSDVSVRTASLETRVDVTRYGDGSFFERLGQVRRELAYSEWRKLLPCPAPVLDMLTGEPAGFTVVARRYRMHNRRALQLLIHALDLWPQVLGPICKAVDQKALDREHARLAA